jgi:SAM-dependent methyltransferase
MDDHSQDRREQHKGREPDYFSVRTFRNETSISPFKYPLTSDRDGWLGARLGSARQVLEIGAGDRPFLPELQKFGFSGAFRTIDVGSVSSDFRSLSEIHEQFDTVIMREVVEHLPRDLFYAYLERLRSGLLVPGGRFALTTPNTWAPHWVLADYTHISPWPPHDMYAILRYFGFAKVEIVRVVWPSRLLLIKRLYWKIHSRFYDMDYAGSYIALAS